MASENPQTDQARDPRAQFVAEATALCTQSNKQIEDKLVPLLAGEQGPEQAPARAAVIVSDAIAPGVEDKIVALRALEPPPGLEQGTEVVLAAVQRELRLAEENPLQFMQRGRPFRQAEQVAEGYGIGACGGIR